MKRYGTQYGGWVLPNKINLKPTDSALCIGAGEDISFDLLLSHHTKCNVFIIDPTQKAKIHYEEVKSFYDKNTNFTGNIQKDYIHTIKPLTPNFNNITFIDKGVSNTTGTLKFYKQSNPNYVSQSLEPGMFTDKYDIVPIDTLLNIKQKYTIKNIELIKLDIEGTEIKVLDYMLNHNIIPKYLLVEFDLILKNKDTNKSTGKILKRLLKYYNIFHNDNFNITFIRK